MSLYDPTQEHSNCGFGLIAHLDGESSHRIVRLAVGALGRLEHRGAVAADGLSGDGCGIMLKKPDSFFQAIAQENDWRLSNKYAVGMIFLPQDTEQNAQAREVIEAHVQQETLTVVGWRQVPVRTGVLSETVQASMPNIMQVFINAPPGWVMKDLERRLYIIRRRIEKQLMDMKNDCYIVSLSNLVIVYKALCLSTNLAEFYSDLADRRLHSSVCLFHQRFSTNTTPRWELAQPFRVLAHNGEINTLSGNRNWSVARSYKFKSPLLPDLSDAKPFVNAYGSDSSSLDNMLEMFLAAGMDLFRALRLLIPPAWQQDANMDDDLRAFYDFSSMYMEPWDGPAGIVLTDGRFAACVVDRNGLRPARYVMTQDKLITLGSEIGLWDYAPDEVVEKGRIGPGEMLVIDMYQAKIWRNEEIDNDLKMRHPYKSWMEAHCQQLDEVDIQQPLSKRDYNDDNLLIYQKLFGYTREDIEYILLPLATHAQEAVGSMGDDAPLAILSTRPRLVSDYFRQRFAQVTNPAIDPLRERFVMSLNTSLGKEHNVFNETYSQAHRLQIHSPILLPSQWQQIQQLNTQDFKRATLQVAMAQDEGLAHGIKRLCQSALTCAEQGVVLLVLSDRDLQENQLPIPMLFAVSAINHQLVQRQFRCDVNILVETACAFDVHQCAVLIGFGATVIYPYLAYETLRSLHAQGTIKGKVSEILLAYRTGLEKGLLKIMSKMGISTISSYRNAQLFDVVGLSQEVTDLCFPLRESVIAGAMFSDFEQDLRLRHQHAWYLDSPLEFGGYLRYTALGEYHCYNPDVVMSLQRAVKTGDFDDYQQFTKAVNHRPVATLRDLLNIVRSDEPIAVDQVEPAEQIFPRFDTAAMSIGALSPEAHEALAEAMNALGGHSNSGEGGEDPARFSSNKNSRIKQIASGRFGVTPHYLTHGDVLQIKIAQGAKPGEGGQLPGHKVTAEIARLRYAVPGVTLISPPPHHDIYSIEDLAQLIFDLKQVNPQALVSVKLVSQPGVGTIACGVAKANADLITISGYDGGTGASPLSSVKHAGSPWEMGLLETHQALVYNKLRHRVRLQVDGGLKTGLDVVKAALLGAESFGFGTTPMIALGCKYLRACHLNNCATGVATQDETLRHLHFTGNADRVMHYFRFLVEEIRALMAQLGVREFNDLIGNNHWLEPLKTNHEKQNHLDLSIFTQEITIPEGTERYFLERAPLISAGQVSDALYQEVLPAIKKRVGGQFNVQITNVDRSFGAKISGEIARRYGNQGLEPHALRIFLDGTAGQSFGVWNAGGVHLVLTGDANDYVGKGMAGGKIVLRPHKGVSFRAENTPIMGNTCLYGATGGLLYAAGCTGERFAVRNSGAIAIVEGVGDHGCEYMTGGIVVILGEIGRNFAAGMTGGFAYVLREHPEPSAWFNPHHVDVLSILDLSVHQEHLRSLINDHVKETASQLAEEILADFEKYLPCFYLIKPKSSALESLLGHTHHSSAQAGIMAQ